MNTSETQPSNSISEPCSLSGCESRARRILVVDDDEGFRRMLMAALNRLEFTAIPANNGNEGLRALADGEIDLVLLDIMMPEKDGLETLREINRSVMSEVPVIAISSGGLTQYRDGLRMARALGAKAVLEKPFSIDDLHARIREILS